jgi:uncharacterized membrane protein YjfL (UPF0719 family)
MLTDGAGRHRRQRDPRRLENGMTDTVDPIILNTLYACMGGLLTLLFMWLGCKVFSHIVNFSIPDQLRQGNTAVGQMIMGMFIGIGTAMGLVIGLGLN